MIARSAKTTRNRTKLSLYVAEAWWRTTRISLYVAVAERRMMTIARLATTMRNRTNLSI